MCVCVPPDSGPPSSFTAAVVNLRTWKGGEAVARAAASAAVQGMCRGRGMCRGPASLHLCISASASARVRLKLDREG
jgi:hypothetical protein